MTLSFGLLILYLMPALCLFAQLLLQVFLFNPDKIGLAHTTHGNSFLQEIP